MRVLFVAPAVPWPLRTGGALRTFHLIRACAGEARIHLRAVEQPGLDTAAARRALEPSCAGVEIFPRSPPSLLERWTRPRIERWFGSVAMQRRLHEELDAERGDALAYDVVHVDEACADRALPPSPRVPRVVQHHKLDVEMANALARTALDRFDARKVARMEARTAATAERHVVCSAEDRARLLARHPRARVDVVPNAIDPSLLGPPPPFGGRDDGRVLFLGSLAYPPNQQALAWYTRSIHPRVHAAKPSTMLEIVGSGGLALPPQMLGAGIAFHGEVADVRPAMARASLLAVPLPIGGGTRIKILEALALGCPVVSTRVGAEGLGLEHGVHALLADDTETFTAAVLDLLTDRERARQIAARGREHVLAHFSLEHSAQQLLASWRAAASKA
jgi:glycosyltransferase involved in cell wall biosynthesis